MPDSIERDTVESIPHSPNDPQPAPSPNLDFDPVEINGELVSMTVLRERR